MSNLTNSQLVRILEMIGRVDRLPTGDILLAQDQLANHCATLKTINENIERLISENIMCKEQAD